MSEISQRIEALIAEGVRHQQAENFDAAERAYRGALQLDPTQPQALALLGMLAGMFGDFQTAIDRFLRALQRDPNNADLYHNLGETYRHVGDAARALPCFAKAIELRPELYLAYRSAADTALAAMEKAPPQQARELKQMALQYRRALGAKLHKIRHAEALGVLREALETDPFDPETLRQLGNCLNDHGLLSESVEMFHRAIAVRPNDATTYSNLGTSLYSLGQWDEATAAFERALEIEPDHKIARTNVVTCHLMHFLYEDEATPEDVYTQHRRWGETVTAELAAAAAAEAQAFSNSRDPDRRLRVGFLSGDFRDHPVAQFFRPLLAHHDRSALEIYCYAERERTDAYTPVLQQAGGTWRLESIAASDAALREQLRADQIDIAIDLSGQTGGTRLRALAIRAAPVTASWLGYPATTGLSTIDWRITDALADPPGYERYYTERLLRIPDGFLCYQPSVDNLPPVAALPASQRGAITFGSFNNVMKLSPATIACWSQILKAVPTARLVLKAGFLADPHVRTSLAQQFTAQGIDPARVELRSHLAESGAHLAAYGEIDIALDPLIYNGTTTTCEALIMGVPIITWIGDRHAARVGFDLLSRIGLSELAAPDRGAYVARAVDLANDLARLRRIRGELRQRMLASPLCDAQRFARQFEAGLRRIWREWCAQTAG
jgi:protein O-GlcNAc transferase